MIALGRLSKKLKEWSADQNRNLLDGPPTQPVLTPRAIVPLFSCRSRLSANTLLALPKQDCFSAAGSVRQALAGPNERRKTGSDVLVGLSSSFGNWHVMQGGAVHRCGRLRQSDAVCRGLPPAALTASPLRRTGAPLLSELVLLLSRCSSPGSPKIPPDINCDIEPATTFLLGAASCSYARLVLMAFAAMLARGHHFLRWSPSSGRREAGRAYLSGTGSN